MRIIYNKYLPVKGFAAIMLFGVVFARREYEPLDADILNHEAIHRAQAKECGGYLLYYTLYLCQWLRYGYALTPFECEAYDNQKNLNYLNTRDPFTWKLYRK